MPDTHLAPSARRQLRFLRVAFYACCTMAGVAALVGNYPRLTGMIGSTLYLTWTIATIAGALISLAGALINNYRVEWVATYIVGAGIASYAVLYWTMALKLNLQYSVNAMFATALLIAVYHRSAELAAHAAKMRAMFFALGE